MSISEHAEEGRQQILAEGITSWPQLVGALAMRFGKELTGFIVLAGVLAFVSWLLWGQQLADKKAQNELQQDYIQTLKLWSTEKSDLVRLTADALNNSATANSALATSITELKEELRRKQ